MKILVAVDGSKHALAAVKSVIRHADWYREPPSVELVTVHLPVPAFHGLHAVVGTAQVERYYREEGEAAMSAARRKLEAAKIPYRAHVLAGDVAKRIVEHAARTRCDVICMGSRGMNDLGKALLGSVATKVLNLAKVPVLLVKENRKAS
jgi:nucleotide-binding universal stress UspA family protein